MFCAASSSMLLVNKLAVMAIPFSIFLLLLQSIATAVALGVAWATKMVDVKLWGWSDIKKWLLVVIIFLISLVSSLQAFIYVNVPTTIVFRNLTSFIVAAGEWRYLGRRTSLKTALSMGVIVVGCVVFASHDFDLGFHWQGYAWLGVNILSQGGYTVYTKFVLERTDQSSWGLSFYNNTISLVPLFVLVFATQEAQPGWHKMCSLTDWPLAHVILSCVLGLFLSVSALAAQKALSALSFSIANNCNKFLSIILSAFIFDDAFSAGKAAGVLLSLVGGALYSFVQLYEDKLRKAAAETTKTPEAQEVEMQETVPLTSEQEQHEQEQQSDEEAV